MKLGKTELILATLLSVMVLLGAYGEKELNDLSRQVVRLHVIANSDSEEDQALKLTVRDAVLKKAMEITDNAASPDEAIGSLEQNIPAICDAAEETISACGSDFSVRAEVGREKYDTRVYDDFSLPAGEYTSLRVIIGEGKGKNWWCVVFPPLCTASVKDYESVSAFVLDDESEALITESGEQYVIKFKLLEIIGTIRTKLCK